MYVNACFVCNSWVSEFFQDKKLVDSASLFVYFAFWISADMVRMPLWVYIC